MSRIKALGLLLLLSSYGCKTTDGFGAKAAEDLKSTAKQITGDKDKKDEPKNYSPNDPAVTYFQIRSGRMGTDKDSNEVVDKVGTIACTATNHSLSKAISGEVSDQVKNALKTLAQSSGNFGASAMHFMATNPSQELFGYVENGEFLIMSDYQVMKTLAPTSGTPKDDFDKALALVLDTSNDLRVCPKPTEAKK